MIEQGTTAWDWDESHRRFCIGEGFDDRAIRLIWDEGQLRSSQRA